MPLVHVGSTMRLVRHRLLRCRIRTRRVSAVPSALRRAWMHSRGCISMSRLFDGLRVWCLCQQLLPVPLHRPEQFELHAMQRQLCGRVHRASRTARGRRLFPVPCVRVRRPVRPAVSVWHLLRRGRPMSPMQSRVRWDGSLHRSRPSALPELPHTSARGRHMHLRVPRRHVPRECDRYLCELRRRMRHEPTVCRTDGGRL